MCHITVSFPCFKYDHSLTSVCHFICAYRPFSTNGAVSVWRTKANNLEERNYHWWKPRMSFLEQISCSFPMPPLPPHLTIDIIDVKFAGIDLPDFLLHACPFSFSFCIRCPISILCPYLHPVKICFTEEMCSYVSFSFL